MSGPTASLATRPTVQVEGLRKTFRGRRRAADRVALDGFDLSVAPGEFVCLLGPSGCGKSTLLDLLAGFSQADGGRVIVGGEPVSGPSPERGVLFQSPMLFPWLTTLDNVLYGPRARHQLDADVRQSALDLLATVGLSDAASAYPHELSGGMRHRAAFARVLVNRPRLLLMDEPFAALDAITRDVLHEELARLRGEQGLTVLFVTHNVREAVRLGDRVLLLSSRPGRVARSYDVRIEGLRRIESPEVGDLAARITDDLRTEIRRHGESR